tara:strand:+ start:2330 stop:2932 length:603 start_codon:yes stop_codon:yes gene_type:complete
MIQQIENPNDKIVSLASTGNQKACEQLIDMLYPVIEPIVRKHLSPGEEKQDVLQEIFMKIFCNLEQFSGQTPIRNWSSKIALNTCYDRLRKKRIRPDLVYGQRAVDTAARPRSNSLKTDRSFEYELVDELINELLSSLNPQERTVITLIELKEKSVKEVCEITGWSESKVKVTKMRAKRKLEAAVKKLENDPLSAVGIHN